MFVVETHIECSQQLLKLIGIDFSVGNSISEKELDDFYSIIRAIPLDIPEFPGKNVVIFGKALTKQNPREEVGIH